MVDEAIVGDDERVAGLGRPQAKVAFLAVADREGVLVVQPAAVEDLAPDERAEAVQQREGGVGPLGDLVEPRCTSATCAGSRNSFFDQAPLGSLIRGTDW